jgi:hypothetical protein
MSAVGFRRMVERDRPRCCSNTRVAMPTWSGWRLKDTLPFPWRIIERPKDQADATPVSGVTPVGISVPIGSLNRLLLWGMFLATLPNSLLRYGCEIFATLRIFLNRVTIQDRFSAEVLSKQ